MPIDSMPVDRHPVSSKKTKSEIGASPYSDGAAIPAGGSRPCTLYKYKYNTNTVCESASYERRASPLSIVALP